MTRFTLYQGGELFINRIGTHWSVDVFAFESADPVYHAFYDTEAEALADADLWQKWDSNV